MSELVAKCGLLVLLILLFLGTGCTPPSNPVAAPEEKNSEPAYAPTDGAVAFEIGSPQSKDGKQSWVATYQADSKTARFAIELDESRKPVDQFVTSGKGRFIAESGSDASSLLAALAKALEAKKIPKKTTRVADLPFEFASFGNNVPRFADGSFGPDGKGNWRVMKIFLHGGEGEVFLNLNPVIGKGEFTIKDPDYGDIVLAELAKVL